MNKNTHKSALSRHIGTFIGVLVAITAVTALLLGEREPDIPRQQAFGTFNEANPAGPGSMYPSVVEDGRGGAWMSWILRIDETTHAVQVARRENGRWNEPETVIVAQDLFVNWADFPSMATLDGQAVAVHWLHRHPAGGTYAYDVKIAFREGDGRWGEPITAHRDGTPTEHGFVSMAALSADEVLAVWLDGREMTQETGEKAEDVGRLHGADSHAGLRGAMWIAPEPSRTMAPHPDDHGGHGAMTLRSAVIHRDGTIRDERIIDEMVCECCQTDGVLADGRFHIVYRNRTAGEVRDIHTAAYDLRTRTWSRDAVVNEDGWEIGGCPVNGPAIADGPSGLMALWYTEAGESPAVKASLMESAGEPVHVSGLNATMGRVDVKADSLAYHLLWSDYHRLPGTQEVSTGLATVRLATLAMFAGSGSESPSEPVLSEPVDLGWIASSRKSGMPRMARVSDGMLVVWTQTDPQTRVKTLLIPEDRLGGE